MSDPKLTVARLVDDVISGIEIHDDPFSDLLDELGIMPKIERRAVVTSEKPAENETRAYFVDKHTVPGMDGETQVYACTCRGFKFHRLDESREEILDDPERGFEQLGRCKHGDELADVERTPENRDPDQQGFEEFAADGGRVQDGGSESAERTSPCDDCGEREAERVVQCPIDEERRLDLCAECYDDRGPGIEVYHVQRDSGWEVNGGRAAPRIEGMDKHHMGNTSFPSAGWIGNPHPMEEESDVERWRVLKAFRRDLLEKVRDGEFFAHHLGKLRGKRVACWCRSADEEWPGGDGDPCHLDVVHAALMGLYREESDAPEPDLETETEVEAGP